LKVNLKESFAYSDSLRDLPMLKLVGNPIVVDPNEKLLEIAKKNNWEVL
jgi:phosphoserine phosphatase